MVDRSSVQEVDYVTKSQLNSSLGSYCKKSIFRNHKHSGTSPDAVKLSIGVYTVTESTIDGTSTTYTLPKVMDPNSIMVFVDGIAMVSGAGYTIAGLSIIFDVAPVKWIRIVAF